MYRFVFAMLIVVVLVAAVLPATADAKDPSGGSNTTWMQRAKQKVWGSNGSNGAAARTATRMAKNGVVLPSGQSKWLGNATNRVVRGSQNMYQRTHR